jgi:hypothetical protein
MDRHTRPIQYALLPLSVGAAAEICGRLRLTGRASARVNNVVMTNGAVDKAGLAELQDELRSLLNQWDPIGICDELLGFPPDEYDCLIGPLDKTGPSRRPRQP